MKKLFYFVTILLVLFACNKDDDKSQEKKLTAFSIDAATSIVIDEGKKTVSVLMPVGMDITALVPVIKVSDLATVKPASGVSQDFTNPVDYTVTAEDGSTAVYKVTVTVGKNTECKITSFTLEALDPVVAGAVSEEDKTVTLSVPYGTDLTTLVPTILISPGASISPESGAEKDFTQVADYTVTAENGDKAVYKVTVSVAAFVTRITGLSTNQVAAGDQLTINGNFAGSGNVVTLEGISSGLTATIVSQSATSIVVTIPSGILGEYGISVVSNGVKDTFAEKITVVDGSAPRLTSLEKTSLVKGIDNLVINGINLGTKAALYFQMVGESSYASVNIPIDEDGKKAVFTASGLVDLEPGEYEVWIRLDGKTTLTNRLKFKLEPNNNPIPLITSVSDLNPCAGTNVTIYGSNFGDDAVVHLDMSGGMVMVAKVVSRTPTEIVFNTDQLVPQAYEAIMVVSGGQTGTYNEKFTPSVCTPEYQSISPNEAKVGTEVTIRGKHFISSGYFRIGIGGKSATAMVTDNYTAVFQVPVGVTSGAVEIVVKPMSGGDAYFTIPSHSFKVID